MMNIRQLTHTCTARSIEPESPLDLLEIYKKVRQTHKGGKRATCKRTARLLRLENQIFKKITTLENPIFIGGGTFTHCAFLPNQKIEFYTEECKEAKVITPSQLFHSCGETILYSDEHELIPIPPFLSSLIQTPSLSIEDSGIDAPPVYKALLEVIHHHIVNGEVCLVDIRYFIPQFHPLHLIENIREELIKRGETPKDPFVQGAPPKYKNPEDSREMLDIFCSSDTKEPLMQFIKLHKTLAVLTKGTHVEDDGLLLYNQFETDPFRLHTDRAKVVTITTLVKNNSTMQHVFCPQPRPHHYTVSGYAINPAVLRGKFSLDLKPGHICIIPDEKVFHGVSALEPIDCKKYLLRVAIVQSIS